jgi:hypothetical protein
MHVVFYELSFPAKDEVPSQLPSQVCAIGDLPFTFPVSFSLPTLLEIPSFSPTHFVDVNNSSPSSPPLSLYDTSVISPLDVPDIPDSSPATSTSYLPSIDVASPIPSSSVSPENVASPISSPSTTTVLSPVAGQAPSLPESSPSPTSLDIRAMHPMTTRSRIGSLKPKSFLEFHLYHTTQHPFKSHHTILQESEPTCFKKAAGDPRWQQNIRPLFPKVPRHFVLLQISTLSATNGCTGSSKNQMGPLNVSKPD